MRRLSMCDIEGYNSKCSSEMQSSLSMIWSAKAVEGVLVIQKRKWLNNKRGAMQLIAQHFGGTGQVVNWVGQTRVALGMAAEPGSIERPSASAAIRC
jgi:hypothetical protein